MQVRRLRPGIDALDRETKALLLDEVKSQSGRIAAKLEAAGFVTRSTRRWNDARRSRPQLPHRHLDGVVPLERPPAGQAFVADHPERVDVPLVPLAELTGVDEVAALRFGFEHGGLDGGGLGVALVGDCARQLGPEAEAFKRGTDESLLSSAWEGGTFDRFRQTLFLACYSAVQSEPRNGLRR